MVHALLEDFPAAVAPLRESLDRTVRKFGPEHFEAAVTRSNYGVVLAHAGDVAARRSGARARDRHRSKAASEA